MRGLLVHPSARVRHPELGVLCGAQEKAKVAWGALCLAPHPNPSSFIRPFRGAPCIAAKPQAVPGGSAPARLPLQFPQRPLGAR